MDKIHIKDLEIYAWHGVNPEEKVLGQKFFLTLTLHLDLKMAGVSDDLSKTVNYGLLCHEVSEEFKKVKYDLIERAAERTAEFILSEYAFVQKVDVLLKKPWAPIGLPVDYAAVEIHRGWHTAYIGMGANMGDKRGNIKAALEAITASGHTKVTGISKFYETAPVGYVEQDDFLNCVVALKTQLSPRELVLSLLQIEKDLKRERIIKWGPRTIDLDVLLYDDIITEEEECIIPHPRMHERMFVLKPLCDLAPYAVHPILRKRMKELLEQLEAADKQKIHQIE